MRSSSQRKLQKALETAKEQRQTLRANKTHEGQHDIDNNETTTIPSSPKRSSTTAPSTHQPWPGYVSVGKKTAGANDAGPYGGIYAKANSKGAFCANNATTSPLELYKNALIESSAKQDAQQDKTSRKLVGFFKSVLPGNKGDIATTSSVLTTLLTNDSHLPSVINGALKSHDPANRIVDEAMKYADKSARFELK